MDMYFGLGGELLTPLDEMLDVDIKLSLELDLELKDPLCGLGGGVDDWGGWGSLGTSPSLDVFGEKEACVMVSPESVMPFIKREIKQEPPPRFSPIKLEEEEEETSHSFEQDQYDRVEVDEDNVNDDDIEEEEEEDDDDEEDEDEEEEEEDDEEEEIKIQPKERNLWNSILTKPTVTKSENIGVSYQARPKTEVSKPAHLQNVRILHQASKSRNTDSSNSRSVLVKRIKDNHDGYPKPAYSYSCLIAMALKNSMTGSLPVSEIYNFMCEHFPYFKSAPAGWKNSVRHNLSLNKCFEKIEKGGAGGGCRKGCLWAMNPAKISKMDDEVAKWSKKDPAAIRRSMKYPEELEKLEKGDLKIGVLRRDSYDSGAEAESSSDSETEEVPPSLKRFDSRLSSQESNDLGLPDEMYEELGLLEEVMSSDTDGEPGPQVKRVRLGLEHYPRHSVRPV